MGQYLKFEVIINNDTYKYYHSSKISIITLTNQWINLGLSVNSRQISRFLPKSKKPSTKEKTIQKSLWHHIQYAKTNPYHSNHYLIAQYSIETPIKLTTFQQSNH